MLAVSELDGLIFFLNGVSKMLSFVTLGHRKLGMSVQCTTCMRAGKRACLAHASLQVTDTLPSWPTGSYAHQYINHVSERNMWTFELAVYHEAFVLEILSRSRICKCCTQATGYHDGSRPNYTYYVKQIQPIINSKSPRQPNEQFFWLDCLVENVAERQTTKNCKVASFQK